MSSAIKIFDEVGVERLAGDADFPDGLDATSVSTPDSAGTTDSITVETGDSSGGDSGGVTVESGDSATGNTGPIVIQSGDSTLQTAGDVTITGGDGDPAAGVGGSVILAPGTANTEGRVRLQSCDGDDVVSAAGGNGNPEALGFFGTAEAAQQTIAGALSAVADAPAKAVLTSIIAGLAAYGLAIDGTT